MYTLCKSVCMSNSGMGNKNPIVFRDQWLRLVLVQTCNRSSALSICTTALLYRIPININSVCLERCSRTASLNDGRLCHVQLILTYSVSCVSLSDHMKLGISNCGLEAL